MGEKIRLYRRKLKFTQSELAEKADVSNNYIGQIERGTKKASLETILKIAGALGIHISELFDRKEIYGKTAKEYPVSKQIAFLLRDKKPAEQKKILKLFLFVTIIDVNISHLIQMIRLIHILLCMKQM